MLTSSRSTLLIFESCDGQEPDAARWRAAFETAREFGEKMRKCKTLCFAKESW